MGYGRGGRGIALQRTRRVEKGVAELPRSERGVSASNRWSLRRDQAERQ